MSAQGLADQIALLDLLTSFANVARGSKAGYIRPSFGDGYMVTQGRHPVLDTIVDAVPNDV